MARGSRRACAALSLAALRRDRARAAALADHAAHGPLSRGPAPAGRRAPRQRGIPRDAQPYLTGRDYGLADIGYAPWILHARDMLDVDLERFTDLSDWFERLLARPAIAAERELVAAL